MSVVKILALLVSFLMLTSCSANTVAVNITPDGTLKSVVSATATEIPAPLEDGYILAAENEKFALYYEPVGLTVKILNKATGVVTESAAVPDEESSTTWKNFVNSGIVLEYYKGKAININRADMYSGKPTVKISHIKDGFAAELKFASIGVSLNVFMTLDNNGIRVRVPFSSIKETNSMYKLAAIYVLPFLGYTKLGEVEGYMLIPDGCGALISLEDKNGKFSQPYKSKVYGGNFSVEANSAAVQKYDDEIATTADTANVSAPVFGMVHTSTQNAFLGIIESGNYNAEIYAYPNGVITDYNWISARYIYREVYHYLTGQTGSIRSAQENSETFDIDVVYRFTGGENADYVGLAKSYRDYLKENKIISADKNRNYSTRLDFFAGDREKALIGKKFVAMTTVEEIDNILKELTEKDVKKLTVSLKGWQKNGIFGNISGKADLESKVGSLKEYSNLADKYKDYAEFMLYTDFLNTYANTPSKEFIYQYNGRAFSTETFLEINKMKYRYTAPSVAERIDALSTELSKVKNIGIAFDGVTSEVYSYESGEKMKMFTRQYAASVHNTALENAVEKVNSAFVSPNNYTWKNMKKYFDFAIYGSDYKFVTKEVPFFAIVLGGNIPLYSEYVNFKADTTEYKLKLIESGVYPSFLLTDESPSKLLYTDSSSLFSCEYKEYKEMIKDYDKAFAELFTKVGSGVIEKHSEQNGVAVTVYENGTRVVVNYNKNSVNFEGTTVDAQSYVILSGKAVQ